MKIIFEGEGPFGLPPTQSASATAKETVVEVTLNILVDGQGPVPVPIRTAMTWQTAQRLADHLLDAALQLEADTK
jgi:hypothetical protein